jgi:Site-specific recombinase XerD
MGTNKLAIQVNERLNDFRVKIIDIRTKLLAEGYAANAAQIKQRYLNPTCNTMMLIAGLADYAKRRQGEVGVRITQRTADKYERLLRYLKQYLAQRGKAEDIPVERMNYEFLDGFNLFLQTAHRCRHNGAVAVMDCLRNFVLYCLRNEWITKNPFRYYKLKEDEVQAKEHLTAHELELLSRKALDHRLARIRDVFVFCCLTGLAFADADHLRREHLSQDDEGRWWIHKPREKTSVMSRIPLLPATLEILRRYEHDEVCVARSRVLPTPSNQKMNAYLKEIAAVCGINKVLTTHVARHTFACMAVEYGMPIDVLAKILGHSNTNMTRHYAKFSETVIGREMEMFGQKLTSAAAE